MGVKVWKGAPLVLHLLFVNNCFLFCRTDDKKIIILKEIIDKYGEVSGQIINFQKSENFFNFNTHQQQRDNIPSFLELNDCK